MKPKMPKYAKTKTEDRFCQDQRSIKERWDFQVSSQKEVIVMEHQIRLNATEEVKEFVNAASKCDFDIDIFYNKVIIDAKSILGILSMDLTRVLTVKCYGEDAEFNKTLAKFAVA